MENISKKLKIGVARDIAFRKFIDEINEWWPKDYTWSQDKLKEIRIEGKINGLCTELGPYGFRCDWGRVTELSEKKSIQLKWQIGPNREPIPDPEKASDILIEFKQNDTSSTILVFEHANFENHTSAWEEYLEMMNGKQGWDYILNNFKEYCEK